MLKEIFKVFEFQSCDNTVHRGSCLFKAGAIFRKGSLAERLSRVKFVDFCSVVAETNFPADHN